MQKRTSQSWHDLIESWQNSDLTQKEFCAQQSIAYSGFHYWFKKIREEKSLSGAVPGFAPVKITSSVRDSGSARLELTLPDGRCVKFYEGVDVQFLRALLC